MSSPLQRLNELPSGRARAEMLRCCGSERWAARMIERRPFASIDRMLLAADEEWGRLGPEDWLEAFRHHPRIGERKPAGDWAAQEQAGVRGAAADVRRRLEEGNRRYEERFGHVFLICATGKTADEMLAALESRLNNDAGTELRRAAEQQGMITRLRLRRLVDP